MRSVSEIKSELIHLEDTYLPSGETAEHIRNVSIGMIIGPTCVGKSTVIKEVVSLDDDFSNPGGFTTRELRPTDPKTYRQLDNRASTLEDFLQSVKRGEPVQYAIYDTGHIYGTESIDYPTNYSVLDTAYRAVRNLQRAGFKVAKPIALVVNPDQYVRQLHERFGGTMNEFDTKTRLKEAVKSLEWALEQGDDISWVLNRRGQAQTAAREVIGLLRGYFEPLSSVRTVGERLLKRTRQLQ